MNRRKYPRVTTSRIEADISDGKGFFTGMVTDISRCGLAIADIPHGIEKTADIYSIILDGPGIHFKLLARPVWEKDNGVSKTIGTQIESSPSTWTDFVMRHEPSGNNRMTM